MNLPLKINELKKSEISKTIFKRIKEFESVKKENLFSELSFCILTANFNAEKCIQIQNKIGKDFSILSQKELASELKKLGHRFPNTRANYISEAKNFQEFLFGLSNDGKAEREKLVKNFKGIGTKEASHFLRNIGFKDVAIIDFHIIDLLNRERLIKFDRKKQALNKKIYLEIENILEKLAKKVNLSLAELDLYLWYLETGKVLK